MTTPNLLPGTKFRLYREGAVAGTFEFICIATTLSFKRAKVMDDATQHDCDNPDAAPWSESIVKSRSWSVSFSGKTDAVKLEKIETDYEADAPRKYQILQALTGASGGKTYTGLVHVGEVEIAKTDNGLVTFTSSLTGHGAYVKAAVA